MLAANPGRVYTRRALLESLWGDSEYRDPRTIDVHIRHLREKLEQDSRNPELILTVRVWATASGPMNPLRSVGGRLSIALLLVVAGALGIAYLVVVPRLENQLVDAKFSQLKETAALVLGCRARRRSRDQRRVRRLA